MTQISREYPLDDPQTKAGKENRKLWERVHEIRAQIEEIPTRRMEAKANADKARAELQEAYADVTKRGKALPKKEEDKLLAAIDAAESDLARPWDAQSAGFHSALAEAENEFATHVKDNLETLLGELEPEANRLAATPREHYEALVESLERWHAHSKRVVAFTAAVPDAKGDLRVRARFEKSALKELRKLADSNPMPYPEFEGIRRWRAGQDEAAGIVEEREQVEDEPKRDHGTLAAPLPPKQKFSKFGPA